MNAGLILLWKNVFRSVSEQPKPVRAFLLFVTIQTAVASMQIGGRMIIQRPELVFAALMLAAIINGAIGGAAILVSRTVERWRGNLSPPLSAGAYFSLSFLARSVLLTEKTITTFASISSVPTLASFVLFCGFTPLPLMEKMSPAVPLFVWIRSRIFRSFADIPEGTAMIIAFCEWVLAVMIQQSILHLPQLLVP